MTPHFHKRVPKNKNAELAETKRCLHTLPDDVRAQLLNEKSMDSRVKGYRSIARLTLNWCTYNHRNRSCLPLPLSSILHVVKVRSKIQAGWQEEIKVREEERAPFILLDLNCHAFLSFCYRCLSKSLIPLQGKEREETKGESERTWIRRGSFLLLSLFHSKGMTSPNQVESFATLL